MKTRAELDRERGQAFADGYDTLTRRNCSAWEWFVLKAGSERAARRLWVAADMDQRLLDQRLVAMREINEARG
jgi:hypothetical protein